MEHTEHTLLVGDSATRFAIQMGFQEESLGTNKSISMWHEWKNNESCQPNYWRVYKKKTQNNAYSHRRFQESRFV